MYFLCFLHPPSRRRDQGWGRPMKSNSLNKYIILLNNIYFNKIKHLTLGLPFGFHWPIAWIIPSLACHRDTPCKKVKRSKSHFRIASWHLFGPETVGAKRARSQKVRLALAWPRNLIPRANRRTARVPCGQGAQWAPLPSKEDWQG